MAAAGSRSVDIILHESAWEGNVFYGRFVPVPAPGQMLVQDVCRLWSLANDVGASYNKIIKRYGFIGAVSDRRTK